MFSNARNKGTSVGNEPLTKRNRLKTKNPKGQIKKKKEENLTS